jgi:hypothetical protein
MKTIKTITTHIVNYIQRYSEYRTQQLVKYRGWE